MLYGNDLRRRVLTFVQRGGSKAEAARRYNVSRTVVYNWLNAGDPYRHAKLGPKGPRTLDWQALRADVAAHPDRTQKERARAFGVSANGIGNALRRMGLTRKKS